MLTGLLFAVILVAIVAVPVQGAPMQAVLPTFDTTRLYTEEAFTAAIKPYRDAVARNANDASAHYWLGIAYLHGWHLRILGFAPYAAGYGGQAVAALERTVQLRATPEVMVALLDAYSAAGDRRKYDAMFDRVGNLAQPIPPK